MLVVLEIELIIFYILAMAKEQFLHIEDKPIIRDLVMEFKFEEEDEYSYRKMMVSPYVNQ